MKNKSFYIETYGCASNKADSYLMSTILKKNGYEEVDSEEARFLIINTCAVKQQTENKIRQRLKQLNVVTQRNSDRLVIITGCLPLVGKNYINLIKKIIPNYAAIIDLKSIIRIPEIFKELEDGKKNLVIKSNDPIDKAKISIDYYKGKITGILPISEGCLGNCTYCCVRNARGKLICFDHSKIIENARYQLEQGIKQLYLTSQDCSTYEHDGFQLADLIQEINGLRNDFFLRLGMINPRFLIDNIEQLIKIYKMEKTYLFLHVPVQSGSNRILKRMNRQYRIEDLIPKFKILRKTFPSLTISTDIICGFPGETDDDFKKTVDFIKWLKPEILNISKFTPRPDTPASKMKQLDSRIIKERSIYLSQIFRNMIKDSNEKWLNWEGKVLILHEENEKDVYFGRNRAYKNVHVKSSEVKKGQFVKVKIYEVDGFNLIGKVIQ